MRARKSFTSRWRGTEEDLRARRLNVDSVIVSFTKKFATAPLQMTNEVNPLHVAAALFEQECSWVSASWYKRRVGHPLSDRLTSSRTSVRSISLRISMSVMGKTREALAPGRRRSEAAPIKSSPIYETSDHAPVWIELVDQALKKRSKTVQHAR